MHRNLKLAEVFSVAKYEMKFMFDWGSDSCVWSINNAARELYGYPVLTEHLPISSELKATLIYLTNKHDESLDWDCPQNDLLWSEEEMESFKANAVAAYKQLCIELGEEYNVVLWGNCLI